MADRKNNPVKYGEVVVKCWEDEAYKKRFLEDPEGVLSEAGFVVEEGVTYKVIEQPKQVRYLVLPHEKTKAAVQDMAKRFLNRAEADDALLPEGTEVRIIQNTDDTRHLILPASPQSLSQAELKMVAGGDSCETYTDTKENNNYKITTLESAHGKVETNVQQENATNVVVKVDWPDDVPTASPAARSSPPDAVQSRVTSPSATTPRCLVRPESSMRVLAANPVSRCLL